MESETIIIISCFSTAVLVLLLIMIGLCVRVRSLGRLVKEMQVTGRLRVQKLKMNPDKNHAFSNPALAPDEELSRRGFTMYSPDDVETGSRVHERYVMQTGGQFVEELSKEIDQRQQRMRDSNMRRQDSFGRGNDSFGRGNDSFARGNDSFARGNDSFARGNDSFVRSDSFDLDRSSRQDSPPRTIDQTPPPFLLQSIEENKRKTRSLMNPNANPNGRPSETNPNFIY